MTTMDPSRLAAALIACASGIRCHEAGTGLLIDCGSWLHREDFTSRFITSGTSISGTSISNGALLAATDWEAAVTALHAGNLPASGGERRMLLLAASIAGGVPVSLSDTLTGIDRRNASLIVSAVAHAAGLPDPSRDQANGNLAVSSEAVRDRPAAWSGWHRYSAAMPLSPDDELRDRDDFVAFLRDLHRDFQRRGQEWENPTLDRFLEAMAAWVESSEGWYRNTGKELPPDGNWTYFARALTAATVYE